MIQFAELAGYNAHGFVPAARAVLDTMRDLDITYAVCGGAAVVFHSKGGRVVTPDLDLVVLPDHIGTLRSKYQLHPNTLGVSFVSDGLEVDCVAAMNQVTREALRTAETHDGVRVVSRVMLMLMKLDSGRQKDLRDFVLVFGSGPDVSDKVSRAARRVGMDVEDVRSSLQLARHVPEAFQ